jgi:hypothetical protein
MTPPDEQHESHMTGNGESYVRVYNKDIYQKVLDVEKNVNEIKFLVRELPDRTRALELKFYGIVAGLIALLGILVYGAVVH